MSSSISTRITLLFVATLLFATNMLGATVTGVITNQSGALLAGMSVSAYSTDGAVAGSAVSAASGAWTLTLPAGKYRLVAFDNAGVYATSFYDDADSFGSSSELTVGDASSIRADFVLRRAGRITGRTETDASDPIAGVTVAAYNLNGTLRGSTITDAAGEYTLILAPGPYKLVSFDATQAFAPEFFSEQETFERADVVNVSSDATRADVNFTLRRTATVTGIVSEASTGVPVRGLTVSAYDDAGVLVSTTTSDSSGRYVLIVPPLAVRVVVSDDSAIYATGYHGGASSFEGARRLVPSSGGSLTDVDVRVERAGFIRGTIRDAAGAPVAFAYVEAYNSDGSRRAAVRSDAAGTYRFVLPPGSYRIVAWDEAGKYVPRFFGGNGEFIFAQAITVAVQQTFVADFALELTAAIHGSLKTVTGLPISGMPAEAYTTGGAFKASALSNAAGEYVLRVPAGTYRVIAFDEAKQYGTIWWGQKVAFGSAATVVVGVGETRDGIDITVDEAGQLQLLTVNQGTGAPALGVAISVYDSSGFLVLSGVTDQTGFLSLSLTPSTGYHIAVTDVRFEIEFFESASTFATSRALAVTSRGVTSVTMRLRHLGNPRLRPVGRR